MRMTRKPIDPVSIAADAPLRAAAERMEDRAVGCLVVLDEDGHTAGLVTDRDLVVRALAESRDVDRLRVADVMSAPAVVASPEENVDVLLGRMWRRGIRRLPLVDDDGTPIGLVSLDDLVEHLVDEMSDLSQDLRSRQRRIARRQELDELAQEADQALAAVYERMQRANWTAREAFLRGIDELRARLGGR